MRQDTIRNWVERTFGGAEPKLFLELGAHRGEDTEWMAQIPGVDMLAFEPDPRNIAAFRAHVPLIQAAISDFDGESLFRKSDRGWGREWTYSGSDPTTMAVVAVLGIGVLFKHTEETKRKCAEARVGWNHSEETKQKISESNYGKYRSEETKKEFLKLGGKLHLKNPVSVDIFLMNQLPM